MKKGTLININMNRKPSNIKEVIKNQFSSNTKCLVVKEKIIDNKKYNNLINDFYQQTNIYEKIGGYNGVYTEVIKIINKKNNDCFYVNTEGYDYARYVGIVENKTKQLLSFETWFEKEKDNLIELFCAFIKETKVYDCTLDRFVRHLYTETIHNKRESI